MRNFVLAQLLLALAALAHAGLLARAASHAPGLAVVVRQAAPPATPAAATAVSCADYSRIANLSTIGANSTYRATFFAASPDGSRFNAEVLNAAIAQLPAVIMDKALNDNCGNLTALALVEAERNFTRRIVAQFSDIPLPEPLKTGPLIAVVCASIVLFCGTWVVMP